MTDQFGRVIDYMRVSITDRCNLRCIYCMPNGVQSISHSDILSYEEILRVCKSAIQLGIVNFKVTGGEPLVRLGCADFITRLKKLHDVEKVTITTNGALLAEHLDSLVKAGVDGINISLDTTDNSLYQTLTQNRSGAADDIKNAIRLCSERGILTKVNAVLLAETLGALPELASIARDMPVDVRFIELMPIGEGAGMKGVPADFALERLKTFWPDLRPTYEKRGNGPAKYYASSGLQGRIGFISANSGKFCDSCNRVRLTSTGDLKPCLCYGSGVDLRPLLRGDASDSELLTAMENCVTAKPREHCFGKKENVTECKKMNEIGG